MTMLNRYHALILGAALLVPFHAQSLEAGNSPIVTPGVYLRVAAQPDAGVWVYLKGRADLSGATKLSSREAKGRHVYDQLTAYADRSQAELRAELKRRGIAFKPYFIVNALLVQADSRALDWLARHPEVERIDFNYSFHMLQDPVSRQDSESEATGVEWDIQAINAPQVWAMGYTGQGVVVAGNDTGVDWTHPAIVRQYRGSSPAGVDHSYQWHDGTTANKQNAPYDDHGHGTFTVGEMVGDDGAGNQIGAAPGARWIACKNMNAAGVGTISSYTDCFQWFIAPTDINGMNPKTELAPHVINNSWGCPPSEGCNRESLHEIVNTVQAAGIMLIFSAGNSGPSCGTVSDPPGTFPELMSVGATTSSDEIASFSSRGPSAYDRSLKPNISAPGQGVRSCNNKGGYTSMSGTSMSAPLVAGSAALLWSAEPGLKGDIAGTSSVLTQTSRDKRSARCGGDRDAGTNNTYGFGVVDAKAAVDSVRVP